MDLKELQLSSSGSQPAILQPATPNTTTSESSSSCPSSKSIDSTITSMTESSGNSNNANSGELSVRTNSPTTQTTSASSLRPTSLKISEMEKLFGTLMSHMRDEQEKVVTGGDMKQTAYLCSVADCLHTRVCSQAVVSTTSCGYVIPPLPGSLQRTTSYKGSGEQVQAGNLRYWQLLGPEGSVYM